MHSHGLAAETSRQGRCPARPRHGGPCAPHIDGFSLHAAVPCKASDRKRLEQRPRYSARPNPSDKLVRCSAAGQVGLMNKTPWRDGTLC